MAKKINFVLKVTDAKLLDIKKALEAKNIKLDSIIEVYKEDVAEPSAVNQTAQPVNATAAKSAPKPASTAPSAPSSSPLQKGESKSQTGSSSS